LEKKLKDMKQPKVIFVVDDEAMLRRALARVLGHADYQVHYFENPVEALGRIDELRPALIISDNMMPKMTGFDFLRKIRAERPEIRTLMLTGGCLGDEIRASVAAGEIDCLLEKPWVDDTLIETAQQLLAR
jgi:two-component system C4-dicarboxylate transport response regulator DctD